MEGGRTTSPFRCHGLRGRDGHPRTSTLATSACLRRLRPGQKIDVGGYSLYIECVGSGSPTVVIEQGQPRPPLRGHAILAPGRPRGRDACLLVRPRRRGRERPPPFRPRSVRNDAFERTANLAAERERPQAVSRRRDVVRRPPRRLACHSVSERLRRLCLSRRYDSLGYRRRGRRLSRLGPSRWIFARNSQSFSPRSSEVGPFLPSSRSIPRGESSSCGAPPTECWLRLESGTSSSAMLRSSRWQRSGL